jgi:hypothetical protein
VPAGGVIRDTGSEAELAGASGVWDADPEGVGGAWLPPHGPSSQAIRSLSRAFRTDAASVRFSAPKLSSERAGFARSLALRQEYLTLGAHHNDSRELVGCSVR